MAQAHHLPAPPSEPAWDIEFTRLSRVVQPRLDTCLLDLARRFLTLGLGCDLQLRQTPRGLSRFLAVVGRRGLLCIVEVTLIDGMAVDQGPRAAWDLRLLDASGDVVAEGWTESLEGAAAVAPPAGPFALGSGLARAATAVFVSALGHFDLLQPLPRSG
jgi:hypothetical protein